MGCGTGFALGVEDKSGKSSLSSYMVQPEVRAAEVCFFVGTGLELDGLAGAPGASPPREGKSRAEPMSMEVGGGAGGCLRDAVMARAVSTSSLGINQTDLYRQHYNTTPTNLCDIVSANRQIHLCGQQTTDFHHQY